ncbi:MAG: glycosyltransferase family 39 protein [Bacteroidia bacterium]
MKGFFSHINKRQGTWLISSLMVFQLFWLIHFHEYHNGKWPWPFVSDGLGYYSYLPALFVYDDTDLDWEWTLDEEVRQYNYPPVIEYFGPYRSDETGKWVMKYPPGLAIVHTPMFLVAHLLAETVGHKANGFTNPYRLAGGLTAIFWMAIGLIFIWKFVRLYYDPPAAVLTVLTYYFGTNYFHYALVEPGMTHLYNFAAIAAVMYCTAQWHRHGRWKHMIGLAIALGFVALLRPTNAVIALVPILWGINNFKAKIAHLQQNWLQIAGGVLLCFVVMSPLLLYWKIWGGSWIFASYGHEQFYFDMPMIGEVLFGYHKGWFVYTPLMLLAFVGLFWVKKNRPEGFWAILIYLIVNIYIVSCWWSWWYGGSFGMRALVESSAVLAIGFAAFFHWCSQIRWRYAILGIVLLAGMGLNVIQTFQYKNFIIHPAEMNKEVYWDVFLRTHMPESERFHIHKNLTSPDSLRFK